VADTWETRQRLLEAASDAGYPISAAQLGRFHRAGLIPSPTIRSLGRGLGTESRFPPGSAARLIRVAQVHAETHRLADVAWRLWWEDGGEIPTSARASLQEIAASVDAQRVWLARVLADSATGTEEGLQPLDKLYADAERGPLPEPLAELRRNVGRENFAAVFHGLAAAAVGHPQDTGRSNAEIDRLLKNAFRLDREPQDQAGSEPLDIESFAEIAAAHSASELAAADSAELDRAREDMRALVAFVTAGAALLDHFAGRGTPTLGTASRVLSVDGPHQQMLLLLGGLALRTSVELRAGLEQMRLALAPQAIAASQMYELLGQLREHVPALAEALSDARLGETLRTGEAPAATHDEIRRVRNEDPGPLDAFFAAHPETDGLIETIEKHRDATGS
jgi:hypothetical protein